MAYRTVLGSGAGAITEKKSRFLSYMVPVQSENQAKAIIASIKKEHHQANHSCSAYRVRGQQLIERYNDDGEPGGTAGMPMLEVLRGVELENVLMVSTRYFGGTKLGTGGLVRAYTQSAQSALEDAVIIDVGLYVQMMVSVDYGISGKIDYYLSSHKRLLNNINYGERVCYSIYVETGMIEEVHNELTELTSGGCEISLGDPIEAYVRGGKIIIGEIE